MFSDLHRLTGKELGREGQRQLYGRDWDGPPPLPHLGFLGYELSWACSVGSSMIGVYNTRAASLGLPALLARTERPMSNGNRASQLLLVFRGGFEARIELADVLDDGLMAGLVLHRLMRRAAKERGQTFQHYYSPHDPQPVWYPAETQPCEQLKG